MINLLSSAKRPTGPAVAVHEWMLWTVDEHVPVLPFFDYSLSRRLKQQFNCRPLAELARQLLVAPSQKRIEQVRRAEALHDEIDPTQNFPFEFIKFRITGYRIESEDMMLVGEAVLPDLRLMIDSLSRSIGMPRTKSEPIETPQELATRLNVSPKTIERWRKLGLRWRWMAPASASGSGDRPTGGRKQLAFTQQAVAIFLDHHHDRVDRAQRFSQLNDDQRHRLIDQARQLAQQPGMSFYRVARQLARRSGRAIETIRLLLEQHDRTAGSDKIFADHTGPLTPRQKRVIARAKRMGVSVDKIAEHFRRTAPTIRRVIRKQQAAVLNAEKIEYVAATTFTRDDADDVLLRPEPAHPFQTDSPPGLSAALLDLPEPIRSLYDQPTFEPNHQRSLIVRINYLKFKASRRRESLRRQTPKLSQLNQINNWLAQANSIRQRLVIAGLSQVLVLARQHLAMHGDDAVVRLADLLQLGNEELIHAIDQFDVTQSQTFESRLSWMLKRRFARYEPDRNPARIRQTGQTMLDQLRGAAAKWNVDLPGSQAATVSHEMNQPQLHDARVGDHVGRE